MKIYKNISGHEFIIIKHLENRRVIVQFIKTNSIVETLGNNCAAGKVKDPYEVSRLNKGYLGEYDKKLPHRKQAYQLWTNMVKRCYDPNDKRGYYGEGVEIEARWLCFANFLADITNLDGFAHWFNKENYELDKDLSGNGKLYSRYTCKFVPAFLNRRYGKGGKKLVNGHWLTTNV